MEKISVPSAGQPEWQGEITDAMLGRVIGGLLVPNQALSKALARQVRELRSAQHTNYVRLQDGEMEAEPLPCLLKEPNSIPSGCYCKPGHCAAPVIMGLQMPCRDPEKAKAPEPKCDCWMHERQVCDICQGTGQ